MPPEHPIPSWNITTRSRVGRKFCSRTGRHDTFLGGVIPIGVIYARFWGQMSGMLGKPEVCMAAGPRKVMSYHARRHFDVC